MLANNRWLASFMVGFVLFLVVLASYRPLIVCLTEHRGTGLLVGIEQRRHEAILSLYASQETIQDMFFASLCYSDAGRDLCGSGDSPLSSEALSDFRFGDGKERATAVLEQAMRLTPAMIGEEHRPLVTLSSLVILAVTGRSGSQLSAPSPAAVQQLYNVFLHCTTTVLVFIALLSVKKHQSGAEVVDKMPDSVLAALPALAGALLFGLLPAHVSVVTSLSEGRGAILSFSGLLFGTVCLLDATKPERRLFRTASMTLLALGGFAWSALSEGRSLWCSAILAVLPVILSCAVNSTARGFYRTVPLSVVTLTCCLLGTYAWNTFSRLPAALGMCSKSESFGEGWIHALATVKTTIDLSTSSGGPIGVVSIGGGVVLLLLLECWLRKDLKHSLAGTTHIAVLSACIWIAMSSLVAQDPGQSHSLLAVLGAGLLLALWLSTVISRISALIVTSCEEKSMRRIIAVSLLVLLGSGLAALAVSAVGNQRQACMGQAHLLHSSLVSGEDEKLEATEALAKHFLRRNATVSHHFISSLRKVRPFVADILEGKLALLEGKESAALHYFLQVVESEPYHSVNNDLGIVLWRMGHEEAAFGRFLRALGSPTIESIPEWLGILNNVACAHFSRSQELPDISLSMARYAKAQLKQHSQSEALLGSLAVFDFNLASNLYKAGGDSRLEALQHYTAAAALDPQRFGPTLAAFEQQMRVRGSRQHTPQCTFVFV